MKKLLLLLLLAGFLASCGGGSGGAYSALFGDGPKHLQPAQHQQGIYTYWAIAYGWSDRRDEANAVQQTRDGGYIVVGRTRPSGNNNHWDAWVLKLDKDGKVEWEKRYGDGGTNWDEANAVQQTRDGDYIVVGSFNADVWVLKLNPDGSIAWQKTYGGSGVDVAYSVQQTSDGYIVAGRTRSFGAGNWDFWVLKLNPDGSIAWQKTYGGQNEDEAYSVQRTSDGGYIVVGRTKSFGAGDWDAWILKLNPDGSIAWQKTYGGTNWDEARSVQETFNGNTPDGYIVVGSFGLGSGRADVWVLKLDRDGNVQWQKRYDSRTGVNVAYSVQQTRDGGYIVAGRNASNNGDFWVLKLNQNGTVAWQKTYGGQGLDVANSVQQTSDGYIVAGYTESFGAGNGDVWVLKLDQNGNIEGCPHQGTTNVEPRDTNVEPRDTNVEPRDTNVEPRDTNVEPRDTNVQPQRVCYATFYALEVTKQGTGSGRVTSEPQGINCGQTCSANYPSGTTVTLTAIPAQGSVFVSWGGDCASCGNNPTCPITMDAPKTCTATFNTQQQPAPTYTLTITKQGTGSGTVTSEPQGINCGQTCSANYPENAQVTLTATPAQDSAFAGWSGDCSDCNGTTCTIQMTSNKTCTATFNLKQYTITTSANPPAGGSVTCSPNPVNHGSTSTCTITTNAGYTLQNVTGTCGGTLSENTYTTNPITANCTVVANFTISGSGGGIGGGSGSGDSRKIGEFGGCSMGAGTSPINALAYLFLPMLVALRRFIRR